MGLPDEKLFGLQNRLKKGNLNLITDVAGVKVGHCTIQEGEINTGVTVIMPHENNVFRNKVQGGCEVLNGFGKSVGLVQIEELGTIESPIALTNTLSVGTVLDSMIKYMMKENEEIGVTTGTVNCVVGECNDGRLNDIRGQHVEKKHFDMALENISDVFEEGAVGAGTGMCALGFKGGIGSASRVFELEGKEYTLGALVLSNHSGEGRLIAGESYLGRKLLKGKEEKDKGSIIIVIATDLPLSSRQLKRLCKRGTAALGRTGSILGNGSGDIAIAFSTGNIQEHFYRDKFYTLREIYDEEIDIAFDATCEAVEEAILSSLYHAKTTVGVRGNKYYSLRDFL